MVPAACLAPRFEMPFLLPDAPVEPVLDGAGADTARRLDALDLERHLAVAEGEQ